MIRKMTMEDVSEITRIYAHYVRHTVITFDTEIPTEEEMKERLSPVIDGTPAWVYAENGIVAGFCYAHEWKSRKAYSATAETTIYLHPDYLRRGYGEALMRKLISDSREHSLHALVACITVPNPPSMRLHEKLGFSRVSLFHEVGRKFGRWLDVADYELIL